jgi:4-alpha-glucanotransferase
METASVFQQRRAGILLHITSLPSANLGEDAYRFVDYLHLSGVSVWQMLPINPTHSDGSPYQCFSAHAINPQILSFEAVRQEYWCQLENNQAITLESALEQFQRNASVESQAEFLTFCKQQSYWLDDYVLFCQLRDAFQQTAWFTWPQPLRDREQDALKEVQDQYELALLQRRFEQFLLFEQWANLKHYANEHHVDLFGDMPIFVAHDSADVWASPDLFLLNEQGQPTVVAGVPPDYFSETGQRWGNPLYNWQQHKQQDFSWWQQRIKTQLAQFDLIRIDHFRGFEACWEIPAECETAIDGHWVNTPGNDLFAKLLDVFGELPLVAEDLGIITEEVTALRTKYAMPGMKILHFAFGGGADNPYLPHQQTRDSITYTGTHDNDTTLGWYEAIEEHVKQHVHEYLGPIDEPISWLMIRTALSSVSQMAIVPFQDVLELNAEHRMNIPGTVEGNWTWQFCWDWVPEESAARLKRLNELYGRC